QQSDVKKAEADAAYSIQEQEQRKTIEVASANADIARAERTAELKSKEVDVTKQTLDAQIRAKADAERYAAQQAAEAELFRRTKEAEAKMIERQREAEGIRAVGEAEAEAIRLKALAEAEGIDKKAEAMKKYGEAAVIEMIMAALPEIAKNVAEPLSKVDKITMYGEGNSAKLLSDIVNGTTQVTEGISAGMGIDIKSLIMGALGGKMAVDNTPPVVVVQPSAEAPATLPEKPEET
ncbi:MAG: flotillin family protein, partial [Oscillospiraceae bacterium]|nr:flotillin family protein [Oscillospiraceae bacterium]